MQCAYVLLNGVHIEQNRTLNHDRTIFPMCDTNTASIRLRLTSHHTRFHSHIAAYTQAKPRRNDTNNDNDDENYKRDVLRSN